MKSSTQLDFTIIYLGYLNFILLTPLFSIVFGIVGIGIPANLVTMILNLFLLFVSSKYHNNLGKLFIFFVVIVSISLFIYWSSIIAGFLASQEKFNLIIYNVLMPMFILLLIGNVKIEPKFKILLNIKVLNVYAKALGIILIILFLMFNFPYEDGRPILPGMENPIWLSRIFGTLFIWSFLEKFGLGHGLVDFVYKSILGLIILLIGSRGVIISVFVVLFVAYWKFVRLSSIKRFYFILMSSTLILFSVYFLYDYTPNPESLYSYYRRLELLEEFRSIELISIFGNGLGSFGPLVIGLDQRDYPHNYFFEYLFEFGIFGLFCALAMIMILAIKSKNSFIGYLGFFFLLGSFSSGDIPGNSFYYLSIFVLLLKNRF